MRQTAPESIKSNKRINIGCCILTVENMEQAKERADPSKFDKGGEASVALMGIIKIKERVLGR